MADVIQASKSAAQDVIIIGAAVLFLTSIEDPRKRHRVIGAINRLRNIAHVIDMHQLTKDPSEMLRDGPATIHSPKRDDEPVRAEPLSGLLFGDGLAGQQGRVSCTYRSSTIHRRSMRSMTSRINERPIGQDVAKDHALGEMPPDNWAKL